MLRIWRDLRRAVGLLVLTVTVTACGPTRYEYVKAGLDAQQIQRDQEACRARSLTTRREDHGAPETVVDQRRFNRCMADRGYEVRER